MGWWTKFALGNCHVELRYLKLGDTTKHQLIRDLSNSVSKGNKKKNISLVPELTHELKHKASISLGWFCYWQHLYHV